MYIATCILPLSREFDSTKIILKSLGVGIIRVCRFYRTKLDGRCTYICMKAMRRAENFKICCRYLKLTSAVRSSPSCLECYTAMYTPGDGFSTSYCVCVQLLSSRSLLQGKKPLVESLTTHWNYPEMVY